MPDLNTLMAVAQKDSKEIETQLKRLMANYEELYRFGNKQYVEERTVSGSMEGLEDFYILVQTLRRNRDVIGSLIRGIGNLRNLSKFKFVEQDVPVAKPKKKKKEIKTHHQPEPPPELPPELTQPQEVINNA
jgi:hypothetical protein